jgi:hypothetical protein
MPQNGNGNPQMQPVQCRHRFSRRRSLKARQSDIEEGFTSCPEPTLSHGCKEARRPIPDLPEVSSIPSGSPELAFRVRVTSQRVENHAVEGLVGREDARLDQFRDVPAHPVARR